MVAFHYMTVSSCYYTIIYYSFPVLLAPLWNTDSDIITFMPDLNKILQDFFLGKNIYKPLDSVYVSLPFIQCTTLSLYQHFKDE